MAATSAIPMDGLFCQIDVEDTKEIKDASDLKDHLENLTKSPNTKCPRVSGRPFNKDKICCYECKEFGHMQKECPELNKPWKKDKPGPKKFEDYIYHLLRT